MRQLDKLPSTGVNRNKVVFERRSSAIYAWVVVICIILTCVYLCYLPVFIGTVAYSDDFDMFGLVGLGMVFVILALNVIFILKSIDICRFNKRYDLYIKDLKFKNIELLDDLAAYSKIETEKVVKDLNKAVKMKLIPQGHWGRDNIIFIITSINEVVKIHEQGAVQRVKAQEELVKIEEELKQTMLEAGKR